MAKRIELDNVKIIDYPSQLTKKKVECWLEEFLPKLKRTTSRTQKCRLLETVERLHFERDWNASYWEFVEFNKEGRGTIYDGDDTKLEEFEQTEFQKVILENESSLLDEKIRRWEIKEESGDWQLDEDLEEKVLSRGGEAIVLAENFDELETVVRVQVFDALLFTGKFEENGFTYEIHLSKEFERAKGTKESSEGENQMPFHQNVVHNFVNIELFHAKDEKKKDCLGWITIMEKGGENLRTLLKQEKIDLETRRKIANGISDGHEYLMSRGIFHCDLKLENVLLVCGTPKLIDFGLVWETTGREGYRKMGYARRGSKYKDGRALAAGTPGFTSHGQIANGDGYYGFNLLYFLFCDWKTAWTLLYQPLDDGQREKIDKIVEECGATSIKNLNTIDLDNYFSSLRSLITEVKKIISLKNTSNVFCLDDPNLTQSCKMSSLKQNATKCVNQDMKNLTENVFDQKSSQLCAPISVTTLLRHAIKNDLAYEFKYGLCTFEKILATLTMIVFPRSLAGLNLNPNKKEKEKQENEIEILLNRLCKETYLMESGWQIIRGVHQKYEDKSWAKEHPVKSICYFHTVTLNENFTFTRPATVTGVYLPSSGDLFFHQMTLDRVENGEYVLQNSDFKDNPPVLRILLKNPYYTDDHEHICYINNSTSSTIFEDEGKKCKLVNEKFGNMEENKWYLLPTAYTIQLIPE